MLRVLQGPDESVEASLGFGAEKSRPRWRSVGQSELTEADVFEEAKHFQSESMGAWRAWLEEREWLQARSQRLFVARRRIEVSSSGGSADHSLACSVPWVAQGSLKASQIWLLGSRALPNVSRTDFTHVRRIAMSNDLGVESER